MKKLNKKQISLIFLIFGAVLFSIMVFGARFFEHCIFEACLFDSGCHMGYVFCQVMGISFISSIFMIVSSFFYRKKIKKSLERFIYVVNIFIISFTLFPIFFFIVMFIIEECLVQVPS